MTEKRLWPPKMPKAPKDLENEEPLSEKDLEIPPRRDPKTNELVRTDLEERTVNAWYKILGILSDPTQEKNYFSAYDILWELDIRDEKISSFFEKIEGFEQAHGPNKYGPDYALVDKEKAIASLEKLIEENEKKEKDQEADDFQASEYKLPKIPSESSEHSFSVVGSEVAGNRDSKSKTQGISSRKSKPWQTNYDLSSEEIGAEILKDPELKSKLGEQLQDREVTITQIIKALKKIYHISSSRLGGIVFLLEKHEIVREVGKHGRGVYYFRLNK